MFMIHVIATVELQDGKRDAFLAEFRKLVPLVRTEEGCLEYGPTVDVDTGLAAQTPVRTHVVTVVEKWENLEALKKHLQAPHMIAYRSKVKEYVRGTKLQVLAPAD
jgi:quinol monooxygenase YgiN